MLPEFFRLAIPRRRQRIGQILLAPLIIGYKLGFVSGAVVRAAIVGLGFSGVPYDHYERKGREFASLALPRVIRPEALEWIKWHKGQGDVVVVVSGALDIYLGQWCRSQGVECICSALEHRNGVLTGRYLGGSVRAIREGASQRGQAYTIHNTSKSQRGQAYTIHNTSSKPTQEDQRVTS